jgi:hypothetical protein
MFNNEKQNILHPLLSSLYLQLYIKNQYERFLKYYRSLHVVIVLYFHT